jgi:hypothetical protein
MYLTELFGNSAVRVSCYSAIVNAQIDLNKNHNNVQRAWINKKHFYAKW